ncbi:MAG: hypothetical protein LUQ31_03885 [Methanoregula sp.]|nr:hypothetical protein [Methanoregula sp.]
MKKKYLTYAGIVAALLLVGMFIAICLSSFPFPFLPPSAAIDPVTSSSVDENNMLVISGTTTLPWYANMSVAITTCLSPGNCTGGSKTWTPATIIPSTDGGRSRWRGEFDLSRLQPADYQITVATYSIGENYTFIENLPLATGRFTLGDDTAAPGAIRKRSPAVQPYIRINPLQQTGSSLKITGITSLAPATPLEWILQGTANATANSSPGFRGTILVTKGTAGVNRWSVQVENRTLEPTQYRVTLTGNAAGNTAPGGTVSASTTFVPAGPATSGNITALLPVPAHFIAIDTFPDIHTEGVYVITGTTSLPAGQDLTMNVYPASFETGSYNFSVDAKDAGQNTTLSDTGMFSGAAAGTVVVNGTGRENLWSFKLETYKFSPGEYLVNVSNDNFDLTTRTMKYGNLFSSRVFPITEEPP